jgi:MFS family permease
LTADERHISGIGVFFTVFAVTMMVLKPLSGKMQDRTGLASVLVPAFICMTASACIISFAQTLWLMIIAALLLAFGQGAGQPALLSSCAMVGGKERRGVALSTYYLGMDVGLGIGNVTGAQVAHALGFTKAYLMCAAMLAIGLIVFLTTKHKHS